MKGWVKEVYAGRRSVRETSGLPSVQCSWGKLHAKPSQKLCVHASGAGVDRLQQVGVQGGRAGFKQSA